ncbi:MAG: caspase family protein, partial [bacterium]
MRALALLLLWAGAAFGEARFAVVIGANRGEADEVVLRFAERDAARFADVLTGFAGVPEEHLTLLKGRDAGRVQAAFAPLAGRIAAAGAAGHETVLFVYYSGHADAQALHLGGSRLPLAGLKGLVDAAGATVAVLVVDACRSGALTRVKGAAPAEPFEIHAEDRLASEGTAIIASSAAGEDAQESDQLEGGVFSHHLIAGLLGAADATGDRVVSLSEAYRYAYAETLRTTSRARFVQHPTYDFRLRGR